MIECELFIGLIIHEIIQISVSIEILHFAGFDVCSGILVGGAEGSFENRTCHDVFQPCANKCRTFAGLDMLKICNAPNLSVYFNGNAFSEIAS